VKVEICRTKVVAPLRDAVRLVNREQTHSRCGKQVHIYAAFSRRFGVT
jgi:hypothetical protein